MTDSLNASLKSNRPQWTIEVQSPPAGTKGFVAVHKRWVVERTMKTGNSAELNSLSQRQGC